MASNLSLAAATATAMLTAFGALANGGNLSVYSGAQPANADQAVTNQSQLIAFPLDATAFGTPSQGVMAVSTIAPAYALATGLATWFRIYDSTGANPVLDGSVGTTGCDLNLATTTITQSDLIGVTSFTVSLPLG